MAFRVSLPRTAFASCVSSLLDPSPLVRPAPLLSYDKHVTPNERVTDFRTFVSGVKANHLKGGLRLRQCQEEVAAILKDRVLVGHALKNDMAVCICDALVMHTMNRGLRSTLMV